MFNWMLIHVEDYLLMQEIPAGSLFKIGYILTICNQDFKPHCQDWCCEWPLHHQMSMSPTYETITSRSTKLLKSPPKPRKPGLVWYISEAWCQIVHRLPTEACYFKRKWTTNQYRWSHLEVISKVDTPSLWCAGVLVPKKSGLVKTCIGPKTLNEYAVRGPPTFRSWRTLSMLSGVTIFSKLKANSGFGRFY